jgi:hypothetical protein
MPLPSIPVAPATRIITLDLPAGENSAVLKFSMTLDPSAAGRGEAGAKLTIGRSTPGRRARPPANLPELDRRIEA